MLSTLLNPIIDFDIPFTVPVKVGDSIGAFNAILLVNVSEETLVSKAACVNALIGFDESAVLSTLDNPIFDLSIANAVFNALILATPVPPFSTGIIPAIFSAFTLLANCA